MDSLLERGSVPCVSYRAGPHGEDLIRAVSIDHFSERHESVNGLVKRRFRDQAVVDSVFSDSDNSVIAINDIIPVVRMDVRHQQVERIGAHIDDCNPAHTQKLGEFTIYSGRFSYFNRDLRIRKADEQTDLIGGLRRSCYEG